MTVVFARHPSKRTDVNKKLKNADKKGKVVDKRRPKAVGNKKIQANLNAYNPTPSSQAPMQHVPMPTVPNMQAMQTIQAQQALMWQLYGGYNAMSQPSYPNYKPMPNTPSYSYGYGYTMPSNNMLFPTTSANQTPYTYPGYTPYPQPPNNPPP